MISLNSTAVEKLDYILELLRDHKDYYKFEDVRYRLRLLNDIEDIVDISEIKTMVNKYDYDELEAENYALKDKIDNLENENKELKDDINNRDSMDELYEKQKALFTNQLTRG